MKYWLVFSLLIILINANPVKSGGVLHGEVIEIWGEVKNSGEGAGERTDARRGSKEKNTSSNSNKNEVKQSGSPSSVGALRRIEEITNNNRLSINAAISELNDIDAKALEETLLIFEKTETKEFLKEHGTKKTFNSFLKLICSSPICGGLLKLIWPSTLEDPKLDTHEDMERLIREYEKNKQIEEVKEKELNFRIFLSGMNVKGIISLAKDLPVKYRWRKLVSGFNEQPFLVDSQCKKHNANTTLICNKNNLNGLISIPSYTGNVQGWGAASKHWLAKEAISGTSPDQIITKASYNCDGGKVVENLPTEIYICRPYKLNP